MQTNLTSCTLKVNTWRYLQVIDPRVTRRRHNHDLTTQKGVITRCFHGMVEHYRDHWARWNDCLPLSPWVWSDQSNQIKRNHSVSYLWYKVYQRAFNHVKTPIIRVLAYPDHSKVFESYTDTSSNELGTVTTWGYCQLRSLRPSRWNLLWTQYSAIEHL
jgi:hypothetical protein